MRSASCSGVISTMRLGSSMAPQNSVSMVMQEKSGACFWRASWRRRWTPSWVEFQSWLWGKRMMWGDCSRRMLAVMSTAFCQSSCSWVRVDGRILSSPRGVVVMRLKPMAWQQALSSSSRPSCRSGLLPRVTATLATSYPDSWSRRRAMPPMMTSSSGWGEKMRALGALGLDCAVVEQGSWPRGSCLAALVSCWKPRTYWR